MKTRFNILCTLVLGALMCLPMYSGTITATGNLQKQENQTISTADVVIKNCSGNVIRTIAGTSTTQTKYTPYPNNGQTIRFVVTRKQNPEVPVVTKDYSINDIGYVASSGSFSRELSDVNITPSRYNYSVKVYVSTVNSSTFEASPASEREYTLSASGGAFPIGSVIAYMGNSSTVAALEESGWFKCDGRQITLLGSLTGDEITALSNTLGGATHLPNLMGVFLRGLDENSSGVQDDDRSTRTVGEDHANGAGTGVRSKQNEGFRSHNHGGVTGGVGNHTHTGTADASGPGGDERASNADVSTKDVANDNGSHSHNITINGAGAHDHTISSQGGNETRPDNVAVYWLIRGR